MADQPITRHTPLKGRCNAKVGPDGEPCDNYPEPGRTRCRLHGGYSTGPRTKIGKMRSAARGIKSGLYVNQLASYLDVLGIPKDLFESIPDTVDLSPEIKIVRANVLRFSSMLARGIKWLRSNDDDETEELRDDLSGAPLGGAPGLVLSVEQLYANAIDQLRKLAKTQNEIKPASDIGGNFRFTIHVSDEAGAAMDEPVPSLTNDDEDELPVATESEPEVKPKVTNGYDDED